MLITAYKNPSRQKAFAVSNKKDSIKTGADQTEKYLPYLKGKRVAILANQTSIIGNRHLVDSLQSLGINIVKVFGPEHGFRGNASAGVHLADEKDQKTGIPIISLYGKKNKPTKEDLADVDIIIYDVQDVGVRFYIGMFPIPMSHGLTVAEFAKMANGEGWLTNKVKCLLKIIPAANYNHSMYYTLPVKPSPNLNTQQSIMLYPSTCMFEGVYINHGRGTYYPFTVIGAPYFKDKYSFSFTPTGIKGMAETPLFADQVCYGLDLRNYDVNLLLKSKKINLQWIMELYKASPQKEIFFDSKQSNEMNNIEIQIGSGLFRQQIIDGVSEAEIRRTWEPGLSNYKKMRKKYVIYKD